MIRERQLMRFNSERIEKNPLLTPLAPVPSELSLSGKLILPSSPHGRGGTTGTSSHRCYATGFSVTTDYRLQTIYGRAIR